MNSKSLTNKWQKRTLMAQICPIRKGAGSLGWPNAASKGLRFAFFPAVWCRHPDSESLRMKSSFALDQPDGELASHLGFVIHRGKV